MDTTSVVCQGWWLSRRSLVVICNLNIVHGWLFFLSVSFRLRLWLWHTIERLLDLLILLITLLSYTLEEFPLTLFNSHQPFHTSLVRTWSLTTTWTRSLLLNCVHVLTHWSSIDWGTTSSWESVFVIYWSFLRCSNHWIWLLLFVGVILVWHNFSYPLSLVMRHSAPVSFPCLWLVAKIARVKDMFDSNIGEIVSSVFINW